MRREVLLWGVTRESSHVTQDTAVDLGWSCACCNYGFTHIGGPPICYLSEAQSSVWRANFRAALPLKV